jgi:predicted ribosome quality control (RQC) complex YloA/Tae2 family protein
MKTMDKILRYELPGGWLLLVGGSAAANDILSTELAAGDDWWFHADTVPGSHVILRAREDEEPGRETLYQAAAVAAYHSKARAAGRVAVLVTRARHVSKPRGVPAGTVNVARGRVVHVRPDVGPAVRLAE